MVSKGMTATEKYHYEEYTRLREQALLIYKVWDNKPVPDKVKAPHYKTADLLMRQADHHKQLWINAAST